MSYKDDYTSTVDLSARTGIKAGGETIISFDLSRKHSSFFRHEATVAVERWGRSLSPFYVTSVHTHQLLGAEPVSGLTHSDLSQRHLPWDCTREHGLLPPLDIFWLSPVFGLVLFCFVLFCFALLCWAGKWVKAGGKGCPDAGSLAQHRCWGLCRGTNWSQSSHCDGALALSWQTWFYFLMAQHSHAEQLAYNLYHNGK